MSTYSLPPYANQIPNGQRSGHYAQLKQQQHQQQYQQQGGVPAPKQFVAELPGSTYHASQLSPNNVPTPPQSDYRMSMISELSGGSSDLTPRGSPNVHHHSASYSDRSSMISELPQQPYKYNNPQDLNHETASQTAATDRFSMVSELPSDQMEQLRNAR